MYQTPEMEIIEAQPTEILAASSLGFGNSINDASEAEAGEYDFFFEDEEF